ncbi:hypothetical protein US8_04112 [Bacillus altitudinis]|nr:hypothetical protein US8_04112 [Bacillus altitudinis]
MVFLLYYMEKKSAVLSWNLMYRKSLMYHFEKFTGIEQALIE